MSIKNIFIFFSILLILCTMVNAMEINFFEEFPSERNIDNVGLLNFSTKIYVASSSLDDFSHWKNKLHSSSNVSSVVYWPTISDDDYWISPWADPTELDSLFSRLKDHARDSGLEIMLDLEFPKNKTRILTRNDNVKINKEKIEKFMDEAKDSGIVLSAIQKSYFPESLLEKAGLRYSHPDVKRINMYYTSMFQRIVLPDFVVDPLFKRKAERAASNNESLAIGIIAPGIYSKGHYLGFIENTYKPKDLEKELIIAREAGVREVIIFRLEGLSRNDDYVKVVNDLSKP